MVTKIDILLVSASLLSGAGYVESSNYRTVGAPGGAASDTAPSKQCEAAAGEQAYLMMQMLAMEGAVWIEPPSPELQAWARRMCRR